jgi:peptidoglycan/LPS O-acetylase OafA/YrhL
MEKSKFKELHSINLLRGIASFAVVLFHVRQFLWIGLNDLQIKSDISFWDKFASWFSLPTFFGGSGVTLFFLISGFCIMLPYNSENKKKFNFKEYFTRRFFRIYPPYFVAIVFTLVIELILYNFNLGVVSDKTTYFNVIFMIQNYTTGGLHSNGALWSLPIEMELYLMFPLVLIIIRKLNLKTLLFVSGACSIIALVLQLKGMQFLNQNFVINWLLWCSGAVLAELYLSSKLKKPYRIVNFLGLFFLGIAMLGAIKQVEPSLLTYLYGIFFFILLWNLLVFDEVLFGRLSTNVIRGITFLGNISYSLYLIHYPFFILCGSIWFKYYGEKPVNYFIPVFFSLLTLPLAWLFYKFIELPTHKLAKRVALRFSTKKLIIE